MIFMGPHPNSASTTSTSQLAMPTPPARGWRRILVGQVPSFASNASDPASDRRPDQLPIGFGTTALSPAAWRWRGCPSLPPVRCLTRLELSNQGAKVPAMHSAQELLELPCQTH